MSTVIIVIIYRRHPHFLREWNHSPEKSKIKKKTTVILIYDIRKTVAVAGGIFETYPAVILPFCFQAHFGDESGIHTHAHAHCSVKTRGYHHYAAVVITILVSSQLLATWIREGLITDTYICFSSDLSIFANPARWHVCGNCWRRVYDRCVKGRREEGRRNLFLTDVDQFLWILVERFFWEEKAIYESVIKKNVNTRFRILTKHSLCVTYFQR